MLRQKPQNKNRHNNNIYKHSTLTYNDYGNTCHVHRHGATRYFLMPNAASDVGWLSGGE